MLLWKDGAAAAKQARNTRTGSREENWKNLFGKLNLSFGILKLQRKKKRKEIVGANKCPAAWIKVAKQKSTNPHRKAVVVPFRSSPQVETNAASQKERRKSEGRGRKHFKLPEEEEEAEADNDKRLGTDCFERGAGGEKMTEEDTQYFSQQTC